MWNIIDKSLCHSFRFADSDFTTAFAFLTEVATEAERLNHHPWLSNEYSLVEFRLRTHDAGNTVTGNTVTERDYRLAAAIDAVASRFS